VNLRPKIVVLAPAITKHDVGEAYLGHRLLENLSDHFSITLVTYRLRKREEATLDLDCDEIVSWDEMPFFHRFERINSMLKPWFLDYYVKARRWLKKRISEDLSICLIYQMTPMSVRYPSPAVGLGIPFVIGPVGGSVPDLPAFRAEVMSTQGQWYMRLRDLDGWRLRNDPLLTQTFREAAKILVTSPHLYGMLGPDLHPKIEIFVEHGLDDIHPQTVKNGDTLRLLYVGRVVRTKGLRDAVRALALLPDSVEYTVDVVGDGPDLPAVKAEARELGLEKHIRFHGRLPRSEIDSFYSQADLFVFPSFREAAGGVIIEAMSFGVPQLCANFGGPAGIVTDKTGILVNAVSPRKFAEEIAKAICMLAKDRQLLRRLSEGSLLEARQQYHWRKRSDILASYLSAAIAKPESTK